jgi:DNA-binding response OmpR family regulator
MKDQPTIVVFDADERCVDQFNILRRDAEVLVSPSLQNALGTIQEKHPALVIADGSRDWGHAGRFVHALRTLPLERSFRILLIVDSCDALTHRSGLHAGADTTLCRPFTPEQLLKTVRCILDAASERQCHACGPIQGALRWMRRRMNGLRSGNQLVG